MNLGKSTNEDRFVVQMCKKCKPRYEGCQQSALKMRFDLLEGRVRGFLRELHKLVEVSLSYHDTEGDEPEKAYLLKSRLLAVSHSTAVTRFEHAGLKAEIVQILIIG